MRNIAWAMPREAERSIAIIGGGFCGAMVAAHLLRLADRPLTVQLIERQPVLGQGVAYRTPWGCHLLNVPAGKMSAFTEDPEHFLRWMQSQPLWRHHASASTFVPRGLYGQYIESVLAEAIATAPAQARFKQITDEAVGITADSAGAAIALASGAICKADQVVLALGNFPPRRLRVTSPEFYQSDRYVNSAEFERVFSSLSPDAAVLLIGSGLTALDIAIALHQQRHQGTIHLVSRRGLVPQSHRSAEAYLSCELGQSTWTTRSLVRQVRQEIKLAIAQGGCWQQVIDALRPETQRLWRQLPLIERQRFLRHVRPYWEVHRHRLAPSLAQTVTTLQAAGKLVVHAGRIHAFEEEQQRVTVYLRSRGTNLLKTLQVGAVVNCTGPECDYRQIQHPLIRSLFDAGLICSDPLGLGLTVAADGAVVDAIGPASNWLYTLGASRKGDLWETTAVPELRHQAIDLAQTLLRQPDIVPAPVPAAMLSSW